MLSNLLVAYLLLILPVQSLWISLRPKADKPTPSHMRRYWSMSCEVPVMLGVLALGAWQAGYSARAWIGYSLVERRVVGAGLCHPSQ